MYSIKDHDQFFDSIDELCDYVLLNGICPSAEIMYNGQPTNAQVSDFLQE